MTKKKAPDPKATAGNPVGTVARQEDSSKSRDEKADELRREREFARNIRVPRDWDAIEEYERELWRVEADRDPRSVKEIQAGDPRVPA